MTDKNTEIGLDEEYEYRDGIDPLKVGKGIVHGGALIVGSGISGMGNYTDKLVPFVPKGSLQKVGRAIFDKGNDYNDKDLDYRITKELTRMSHPLINTAAFGKTPHVSAFLSSVINDGYATNTGGRYDNVDRFIDLLSYGNSKLGGKFSPALSEAFEKLGTTYSKKAMEDLIKLSAKGGLGIGTNVYLHKALDSDYKYDDWKEPQEK